MSRKMDALDGRLEARLAAGGDAGGNAVLSGRAVALLAPVAGERILDAGCGCGDLVRRLSVPGVRAAGVDVCASLLSRASREGGLYARGDAARLGFRSAAFDAVASLLVLHYLPDPGRAVAELARVLRPGGRLLIADRMVSADAGLRSSQEQLERLRNPLLQRILTAGELAGLLQTTGLRVIHEEPFEMLSDLQRWKAGVAGGEARRLDELLRDLAGRDLEGLHVGPSQLTLRGRLWVASR